MLKSFPIGISYDKYDLVILVNEDTPLSASRILCRFPEIMRTPNQLIDELNKVIIDTKKNNKKLTITTFNPDPINYIGALIDNKVYDCTKVVIIVEGKDYFYDEEGALINWQYGYFLWDMEKTLTKLPKEDS